MLQSVFYALIGFLFASLALYGLRALMIAANQAMNFSPSLWGFLVLVTLGISIIGSYFSMRKILKLELVEIFRM